MPFVVGGAQLVGRHAHLQALCRPRLQSGVRGAQGVGPSLPREQQRSGTLQYQRLSSLGEDDAESLDLTQVEITKNML